MNGTAPSASQRSILIEKALSLAREIENSRIFLFLDTARECRWFFKSNLVDQDTIVLVLPKTLLLKNIPVPATRIIRGWAGNQSRFSRIKYAFLYGVLEGIIKPDDKVICLLGPSGKGHLDTIAIHDLGLSWSEEFPFDVQSLFAHKGFQTVMAVVDIALDIGALGREGKSVGTIFVIGDTERVLDLSHQAVFNPFKGYPKRERSIILSEVVESIKELAKLDGAIIVSAAGIVEAAGRHLDAGGAVTKELRGLGARHRAAAGITRRTGSIAVVVSESTGRVMIFDRGRIVATLEPLISRRLV